MLDDIMYSMDIKNLGIILEPTGNAFENHAVLNPGCILVDNVTHLYYRAVREGNFSTIGYCRLEEGNITMRLDRPLLMPEYPYEAHGLEDPRVIFLDGLYYLFYTAYDGKNVHVAYATGHDPMHFQKQGVISSSISYAEALALLPESPEFNPYRWYGEHYQETINPRVQLWEKDTFIFPKKINGKFLLLIRVMPGMQIVWVDALSDLTPQWWRSFLSNMDTHVLLHPALWFETRKIGPGCPPIETPDGWVLIYHAVETTPQGNVYRAAAALLDLKNPAKVIARLPNPLFSPVEMWEKTGDAPNVVFPTGATVQQDVITVYYGAGDSHIAAKTLKLSDLVAELKLHTIA